MTYTILSLESGSILESFRSEDRVLEAAVRIYENEPAAIETIALVPFDDDGTPGESLDGAELVERLQALGADQRATPA